MSRLKSFIFRLWPSAGKTAGAFNATQDKGLDGRKAACNKERTLQREKRAYIFGEPAQKKDNKIISWLKMELTFWSYAWDRPFWFGIKTKWTLLIVLIELLYCLLFVLLLFEIYN